MATLYITVFQDSGSTAHGDPLQELVIAVGGASVQSVALNAADGKPRRTVRCFTDTDCFVTWGSDPTATNDGLAGIAVGTENPEYFLIKAGDKLATISRA